MIKNPSLSFMMLLISGIGYGQPDIDSNFSIEQYVNDILLGEGVEAFNITYTGGESQLGYMTGGEGELAITDGLVLSSDAADNISCPAIVTECADCLGAAFNDPDLLTIANSVPPLIGQNFAVSSVNDGCVLEFDFTAAGDSISFNYIFGSDEYEMWINTQYNDVFAFFLSGPGITGEFDSPAGFPDGAINIAGVPDSDPYLPITISSVNSGTNAAYYINNQSEQDICLLGYTQGFTAEAAVQCGQTYHIKLAIADGSDTALESIVILEAGSFSSNAFDLTATASISGNIIFGGDTTVVESCNDAIFQVVRPDASVEDTLIITIGGTATNGVDYEEINPEIIMEVGEYTVDIPLNVNADTEAEGTETVTIEYLYVNLCGDSIFRQSILLIEDFEPTELDFANPVGICNGEAVLEVTPISGYGPYLFEWNTGVNDTLSVNVVETETPGAALVTVTDVCGNEIQATISYTMPPELLVYAEQLNVPLCAGDDIVLESGISTGVGPFSYDWSTGGNDETETINVESTQAVTLTITDACGVEDQFEVEVEVPVYDPITGNDVELCLGIQGDLSLLGGTGQENLAGNWQGNYTFYVWQYFNYDEQGYPQDSNWVAVDSGLDTLVTFIGPSGNFQASLEQNIMEVTVVDLCGLQASFDIAVVACDTEIPNVFSPNSDGMNDFFRIPGIEGFPNSRLEVFNRWGSAIYQDSDYKGGWDGRLNGNPVADGTYFYILYRSDNERFHGAVTIMRERR
jgi:gliding motility-associated-like protein|tara:strand:+ start:59 stop:2296 length:2238 start_codon:yes stop_codon:yes gene_type:complete